MSHKILAFPSKAFTAYMSVTVMGGKMTIDSRSVMMIAVTGSVQIQRYCLWGVVDCSGKCSVVFPPNDDGCDNGGDGSGCED